MANAQPPSSPAEPVFKVVVNEEGQYSIWLADRELPAGWVEVGFSGPRSNCLAHIDEVWQDMRPVSLREVMAASR